jgi:hypothetical protein
MKFALGEITTADEAALPEDYDALTYLQAIYRGKVQADPTRMRAANMALPYERPKLSVAVTTSHRGMGDMLERRNAAMQAKRLADPVPERPVGSANGGASFRRIVPAMGGGEARITPPLSPKPGRKR